eukprot:UN32212
MNIIKDESRMEEYNCVVFGCHMSKNTGDALAKCVDNGIPVVLCNHTIASNWGTTPDGRFRDEKYLPLLPLTNTGGNVSNITVQESEFKDLFKEVNWPGSFNVFCNQTATKQEGVIFPVMGGYGSGWNSKQKLNVPIVAARVDKSALIFGINIQYVNDSTPSGYAVLAKCIEIAVQHSAKSAEYIEDQVKEFEISKEKLQFGKCVDVVKNIQRVVEANKRSVSSLEKRIKNANVTITKAMEK